MNRSYSSKQCMVPRRLLAVLLAGLLLSIGTVADAANVQGHVQKRGEPLARPTSIALPAATGIKAGAAPAAATTTRTMASAAYAASSAFAFAAARRLALVYAQPAAQPTAQPAAQPDPQQQLQAALDALDADFPPNHGACKKEWAQMGAFASGGERSFFVSSPELSHPGSGADYAAVERAYAESAPASPVYAGPLIRPNSAYGSYARSGGSAPAWTPRVSTGATFGASSAGGGGHKR